MDDFKDILLDGEEVLWSGRPDASLIKPLPTYKIRKTKHFLWLVFAAFIAFGGYRTAVLFQPLEVLGYTVSAISGIVLLSGVITFFDFTDHEWPHQFDIYAVTNRRVLRVNRTQQATTSIFPNSIHAMHKGGKGNNHNIYLYIGRGDDEFVCMYGIKHAGKLEEMIIERFSVKEEENK